jgi:hypothetical protein
MSDTTEAALVGLRERLRDLELDACAVRSRVEEVRSLIELLEHGTRRRPGRPRNPSANTAVPSLDDVRGILRTEETAA